MRGYGKGFQRDLREGRAMMWSWVDAVNLAIQMVETDEKYAGYDVDKLANELWAELLKENEGVG